MRFSGWTWGRVRNGAFWLAFLRSLVARGLSGVQLVTSDAHQGLKDAIATVFGEACWQRCRTHFMTNLLSKVPKRAQPWVATMIRTIYQQPSPEEVHAQHQRVVAQLEERFPDAAGRLEEAGADILAFTAFPVAHWKQVWSNNPQERLNRRSGAARTWWASSRIGPPSSASSARCWPSSTTSGRSAGAISPRLSWTGGGAADRIEDPMLLPAGAA